MAMSTLAGKIKMDELEKVKKLGSGGFGAVYQMTWKRPEGSLQVAAKHLSDPDMHEVNILSSLDHPSVVKLLGYVDEGINFLLVLELCEGGSLRDYLDQHGGLAEEPQLFCDWAKQLVIPLEYLRSKQIVHKDVKSFNYLITQRNRLKLADFGLAKNIDHTIGNATNRASHPWMAPELLTQEILSPNYDIFALGVVIWELWTGKIPFEGLEFQHLLWRVCEKNERLPIPADMPRQMVELLRQCWDRDWHKRPSIAHIMSVIKSTSVTLWRQQIIAGPWVHKHRLCKLHHYIQDIAVNTEGTMAIVDWSAKLYQVYSAEGVYQYGVDSTNGKPDSRRIAVSRDGSTYFVTSLSNSVKVYCNDFKFKMQWVSLCPHASNNPPCLLGLAIDSTDHVYVGDVESKVINKHKQDGSFIAGIKVKVKPEYLAVTSKGTLIIAEWGKPPQIVSKTGQVQHTLEHPTDGPLWQCYGVYYYRETVFATNTSKSFQHEVLCYSVSGRYLGCIPLPDANPRCLRMTENGTKLIVGAWGGYCDMYELPTFIGKF